MTSSVADPESVDSSEEVEDTIRHCEPRSIVGNEADTGKIEHRVTITDAIKYIGLTEDEVRETSLHFQPGVAADQPEDSERMLPGFVVSGEHRSDGRKSDMWRSVQITGKRGENPVYSVSIPNEALAALGYDDSDNRGKKIDVYAGKDGVVAFAEVENREIVAESKIDVMEDVLPEQAANDYREVVVNGKSVEEVAKERGVKVENGAQTIQRNVDRAKQILESVAE